MNGTLTYSHFGEPYGGNTTFLELALNYVATVTPIWFAALVGLVLGWAWRPRWVSSLAADSPTNPAWLQVGSLALAPMKEAWSAGWTWGQNLLDGSGHAQSDRSLEPKGFLLATDWSSMGGRVLGWRGAQNSDKDALNRPSLPDGEAKGTPDPAAQPSSLRTTNGAANSMVRGDLQILESGHDAHGTGRAHDGLEITLTEDDLEEFIAEIDSKDGGPEWSMMIDKSTTGMKYTAWRRDPEQGPTQYRTRTVMERCSSTLMRDFFWDDDFRRTWDDMLVQTKTVTACERTGFQIVHWVRKFPFFCKDREYVIARRIWSNDDTFYCLTKGIHHPEVPKKDKPRRVEVFYSSWRIRPFEGGACEVTLLHHEDMGIQKDIAKLGIRQGMWSAVRKMEPGLRRYQKQREEDSRPLSRCASLANLHTPISPSPSFSREGDASSRRGVIASGGAKKSMRKWVSFSDLAGAAENRRGGDDERAEEETSSVEGHEDGARALDREQSSSDGSGGEGGTPGTELVPIAQGLRRQRSGFRRWQQGSREQLAEDGSEAGQRPASPKPEGSNKRAVTVRVGWLVVGSVAAFVCGLETGLLIKLLVAGAVQGAAANRRAKRERAEASGADSRG
eukprot:TRINITY_DN5948_c0_g1_i1.p1 TRINITY_DN5948_c0_g1~~TRINITY_DN5948_c0_g1_i1.p1  ORF type:complete len:618 (+),score=2.37 TRINITY_DN5948_c0_g1_i1:333-2186(+)